VVGLAIALGVVAASDDDDNDHMMSGQSAIRTVVCGCFQSPARRT
jgi:hypothetical protein